MLWQFYIVYSDKSCFPACMLQYGYILNPQLYPRLALVHKHPATHEILNFSLTKTNNIQFWTFLWRLSFIATKCWFSHRSALTDMTCHAGATPMHVNLLRLKVVSSAAPSSCMMIECFPVPWWQQRKHIMLNIQRLIGTFFYKAEKHSK